MLSNPYQQYQQNQVDTATPDRLLLMMYNGALKFIKTAREGIVEKDIEKANNHIIKVQDIVYELMSSLDLETGELAQNLLALYYYINNRLMEANINKDEEILKEVESLLTDMRDAWKEAITSS